MSKYLDILKCLVIFLIFANSPSPTICEQGELPNYYEINDATIASSARTRHREEKIKDDILSGRYDSDIRPTGGNTTHGETQVEVNLSLKSVSKIDDFKMEYSVQLYLRMEWYDDNLKFAHLDPTSSIKYLTLSNMKRIWMPDIFFVNEKEGHFHSIIKPNLFIRIFPDGRVSTSVRMSLTLGCPMNLQLFPMDTQHCAIIMSSYAWTTEDVIFYWREEEPVQLPDLILPRFSLQEYETNTCEDTTTTGVYSCIRVDFTLVRNFEFYLTQSYIPCILLVIVSWVSFWLDENAAPARVALGITTLLTMATQQANMNKNLPPVSYTKALDVWSETCLVFIFAALLEYAFVNYATRFDKRTKAKSLNVERAGSEPAPGSRPVSPASWLTRRYPSTSKKIDIVARILFPCLFLIFNILYWLTYLNAEDNYKK